MPRKSISSSNAKHEKLLQSRAIKRGLLSPEEIAHLASEQKASRAAGVKSHLSKSARDGTGSTEVVKKGRKKLESRFGGLGKEEVEKRKFEVLEEVLIRPIPVERAIWRDPEDEDESNNSPGPSTSSRPTTQPSAPSTNLSNYTSSTLSSSLTLPIRPKWHHTTTTAQLDRNESLYFSKWIDGIDSVHQARMNVARSKRAEWEEERKVEDGKERIGRLEAVRKEMRPRGEVVRPPSRGGAIQHPIDHISLPNAYTPSSSTSSSTPTSTHNPSSPNIKPTLPSPTYFERNLHVWRQLWRVSEQSQIILVLLDARCPGLHFPSSLRRWLRGEMGLDVGLDVSDRSGKNGSVAGDKPSGKPLDKKKPKPPLSAETKAKILQSSTQAKEKRRTHIPTKRVIIVLTKVDLVELEVVEGWVEWCKWFWKTGERKGVSGDADESQAAVEGVKDEEGEGREWHEADEIDVVGVSSYKEKTLGEDTQNLKHRRRMPHIPPQSLSALFQALERAHAKLRAVPERFSAPSLSGAEQKKKWRWERDLDGRVRREIDWEGLKRGDGDELASEPGAADDKSDDGEILADSDDPDSVDTDPTIIETGSTTTLVPPSRPSFGQQGEEHARPAKFLSIGLIGQPNIGKSSLLNALLGESRVRASKTPGKTKHFQSIFWSSEVRVVDCPGLVMPSLVPMEMQAIAGILPISQISSIPSCIHLASKLLPLERILKLPPPAQWVEETARKQELEEKKTRRTIETDKVDETETASEPVWTAGDIMQGWAEERGFLTAQAGRPDTNRAGNAILRMIAEGKIAWRFLPPGCPEATQLIQDGNGIWRPDEGLLEGQGVLDDDGLAKELEEPAESGNRSDTDNETADSMQDENSSDEDDAQQARVKTPAGRFALLGVYEEESEEEEAEEEEEEEEQDSPILLPIIPAQPLKSRPQTAYVEEIDEDEGESVQSEETMPRETDVTSDLSVDYLLNNLKVPEELLGIGRTSSWAVDVLDRYHQDSILSLRRLKAVLVKQEADGVALDDEQVQSILLVLLRLSGQDDWLDPEASTILSELLAFPGLTPSPSLPLHVLSAIVRPAFSPHPSLSITTSRALSRPAGGDKARQDLFDSEVQAGWKGAQGWGMWNLLGWCVGYLDSTGMADHIGLILPPMLTMMDDYEPVFRLRGIRILDRFLDKVGAVTMKRMGLDKLFVQSLQHSLSLHPMPPTPTILPTALPVLLRLTNISTPSQSPERAAIIAEAVEKGIINGWNHAPTSMAGLEELKGIAGGVHLICAEIGVGVVRWLKSFIPALLAPCLLPPSTYALTLQVVNLQALLTLLRAIEETGRAARWRGQILNGVGTAFLGAEEKLTLGTSKDVEEQGNLRKLQTLCAEVVRLLAEATPSIREDELLRMTGLSDKFRGLTALE